jgi:hypothetical protein
MAFALDARATDRRGYFRMHTRLRVGLRAATSGEVEALRGEILLRDPPLRPHLDPALAEWLGRIEEKLDALLEHAGLASGGALRKEERSVVLSGGGILLPSVALSTAPGATFLLELELPLLPRHTVRCLAQVTGASADRDALALRFDTIHESDRDAIVRLALMIERRARANGDPGAA